MFKRVKYWIIGYVVVGFSLLACLSLIFYRFGLSVQVTLGFGGMIFLLISLSFGYLAWWVITKNSLSDHEKISSTGFLHRFALSLSLRLTIFLILSAVIQIKKVAYGHFLYIMFLVYFFYALFFELIPLVLFNNTKGVK
jgi:hypothetical protein